jgi:hypothetical protein
VKRFVLIAACCGLGAGAAGAATSSPALAPCVPGQLKLTGSLQGATQSLLGTLTVTNRLGRACAVPVAPSRVSLRIGTQVLPTLTVRMSNTMEPPGLPTRKVAAHGHVFVGVQWRNWCGAPRGNVRMSIALTIYSAAPRTVPRRTQTPICVDRKHSSRVAVSRFEIRPVS